MDLLHEPITLLSRQAELEKDMGYLVIGQRPGPALLHVDQLPVGGIFDDEQADIAEDAVDEDGVRHRADSVFARHDDDEILHAHESAILLDEGPDLGVELAAGGVGGVAVGALSLRGVVEVGEIDDGQMRRGIFGGGEEALRDPARRIDAGQRAPELVEGEVAEAFAEARVERLRVCVAPHRLGAVGVVLRGREADEIGRGVLRLKEKPGGGAQLRPGGLEAVPNPRDAVDRVGADPHFEMVLVAVVDAVGHDPVLPRRAAGGERGLHRAGNGGKTGRERHLSTERGKPGHDRHPSEVFRPQAGDRKEEDVERLGVGGGGHRWLRGGGTVAGGR